MCTAYNNDELVNSLKVQKDMIQIEFKSHKNYVRIIATGKIGWAIAMAGIGIAVAGAVVAIPTGGTSAIASSLIAAPAAIGVLGAGTATTAIGLAISAGGTSILKSLRNYKVVSSCKDYTIIKRL